MGRVTGLDRHVIVTFTEYEGQLEGHGRHFRFACTPPEWDAFFGTLTSEDEMALEATGKCLRSL